MAVALVFVTAAFIAGPRLLHSFLYKNDGTYVCEECTAPTALTIKGSRFTMDIGRDLSVQGDVAQVGDTLRFEHQTAVTNGYLMADGRVGSGSPVDLMTITDSGQSLTSEVNGQKVRFIKQ